MPSAESRKLRIPILKTASETMHKNECWFALTYGTDRQLLNHAWVERFDFLPVLSHEPPGSDWAGARGWVTDFIATPAHGAAWSGSEGYLCGPPPMIDAGIARLMELGVHLQHIHYDKFTDGVAQPALSAAEV